MFAAPVISSQMALARDRPVTIGRWLGARPKKSGRSREKERAPRQAIKPAGPGLGKVADINSLSEGIFNLRVRRRAWYH